MSKLIDIYARSCGLEIGEISVNEKFFPLEFSNYFTIQASSKQPSKNYDYWNNVIELIIPFLKQNNIELVQIGEKDDIQLKHVHRLCGLTTLPQAFYILNRSLMHIGNDSFAVHLVGSKRLPIIAAYGETSAHNHGPYWNDEKRTILIESHRNGNIPTYFPNENPKTINFIKPEDIATAIYKTLGVNYNSPINTYFIGQNYNSFILEFLPNGILDKSFIPEAPVTIRLDLHFNEQNMAVVIANGRKANIVTNKPININLLNNIKSNVIGINYEISDSDTLDYIKALKKTGIRIRFFSKISDEKQIADLRLKFFDACMIEYMQNRTKEHFLEDCAKYLNKSIDRDTNFGKLFYRTNKFYLSDGKIYTSLSAMKNKINIPSFDNNVCNVIDNEDFWIDYQFDNIFQKADLNN